MHVQIDISRQYSTVAIIIQIYNIFSEFTIFIQVILKYSLKKKKRSPFFGLPKE